MTDRHRMTDSEIVSWVGRKLKRCMNEDGGDLSDVRQENFDYYMGEPYGDEREGYSKVVTREVLETVEWALPSIMRVFTSGDQVVAFDPVGIEDEPQADQETDITNHYLNKEGNWFMLCYEWFKDALLYPNGYTKASIEKSEVVEVECYGGLTPEGLVRLSEEEGVEITEAETYVDPAIGVEMYNVKVKRTMTRPKLRLDAVPPEQVLVDADCTSLDLDDSDFVCHETKRDKTWLLENGISEDFLEQIGPGTDTEWGSEEENRLFYIDEDPLQEDEDTPGLQKYWYREVYAKLDVDGDGIAERRKIVLVADEIWENEEDSYQPLIALSSIPMPHKHTGMAYVDPVKDLQRIHSTLKRQLLDNLYRINIRRKYIAEGALVDGGVTLEALQNAAAEIIPVRQPGMIEPEATQPILGDLLPIFQLIGDEKKLRTGIAPDISLNPDILRESTNGAFQGALEQASQRIELVTRIFAETGVRQLMLKVHRLLREYMDVPKAIKLRGTWVEVNPADWRDRTDLTVNVGLGFNSKERMVGLMMGLLQVQREAAQAGLASPKNVYNALAKLVEAQGLKEPSLYFTDPDTVPPKEPQPDPAMQIAQLQAQLEQMNMQLRQQELAGKQQIEQMKLALQAKEQDRKQLETWAKVEDMMRQMSAKLTDMELKYSTNVPGALV